MLFDDIIYILLLLASIALGHIIFKIKDPFRKKWILTSLGLSLVLVVSGINVYHPLITTLVNALIIIYISPKHCHYVSFIFSFSYLFFVRTCERWGFPGVPAHTNAIQMLLIIKLIGMAFEVNKDYSKKDVHSAMFSRPLKPTFLDVFHYAFCLAGVLIGPYYKYQTYLDMLQAPYSQHVPNLDSLRRRISYVPIYTVLFLLANYYFPLEYVSSGEILSDHMIYRIFYMSPIFFTYRMRIYVGFVLGECSCIALGLGAYPQVSNPLVGEGPTNLQALKHFEENSELWPNAQYNFETVHNIDEYGSEFFPTIRQGIRSWNRTIQFWLATLIYKQLPFSKTLRMLITMLISSYWHGVHPGYYLCLLSAPFFLLAENMMEQAFRSRTDLTKQKIYDWIWWVIKMQSFSYMGMAFLLLHVNTTLQYWQSIYFIGHVCIIVFYLVSYAAAYFKSSSKHIKSH